MRIAIDARMIYHPLAGLGRYTKSLIKYLSLIDSTNEYLIIQNDRGEHGIVRSKNFKEVRFNYPPLSFGTMLYLHRVIEANKIDVFHAPYFMIPLFAKCPIVVTIHDLTAFKFKDFFFGKKFIMRKIAEKGVELLTPLTIKMASKVITVSSYSKTDITKLTKCPENKVEVIYEAVDSVFKKIDNLKRIQDVKHKFGLNKKFILYVGNTRAYKNLPRLFRAFKILKKRAVFDYNLVIGSGDRRNLNFLTRQANNLSMSEEIIFTGALTDDEVVALMNAADIFVFPSLYEGFGLPPLEAMACGTPVVTSNAGSLPEVMGDAALLINPESEKEIASAMLRLLDNEVLRNQFRQMGCERVKKFSWKETAKRTLEIYREVYKINKDKKACNV